MSFGFFTVRYQNEQYKTLLEDPVSERNNVYMNACPALHLEMSLEAIINILCFRADALRFSRTYAILNE